MKACFLTTWISAKIKIPMKLLLHLYFLFYVVVCIYKQNLRASFISISFTINILKNSNSLELFDLNIILFFNIEKGDNYAFVFMSFHHMSNLCSVKCALLYMIIFVSSTIYSSNRVLLKI